MKDGSSPTYCVLTYDTPHRKTQDLLMRLRSLGHTNVTVIATPWVERQSFVPLIPHRPQLMCDLPSQTFTENMGYAFERVTNEELADALRDRFEAILIAGAGILPEDVVNGGNVINSHPGFLPKMRGLDALKWAIYEDLPIGVTSHIASPEADAGLLIRRAEVPLFPWDTFHSIAYRQWEMEINFLAEALTDIRKNPPTVEIDVTGIPVHRRMPHRLEGEMMERFNARVRSLQPDRQPEPV